jgi:hypothetical protein
VLAALLSGAQASAGEPLDPRAVPEPLKPWIGWALDGKEEARCPLIFGKADTTRCDKRGASSSSASCPPQCARSAARSFRIRCGLCPTLAH